MEIINPATEEVIAKLTEDTSATIESKFQKLKAGQKSWQFTALSERIACIERFSKIVQSRLEELAAILTSETGKPITQARNEIRNAHNRLLFFINNSPKYLADEVQTTDGPIKELIKYEPYGVIANISAWNFPYNVGYNVYVPALIGGNAVMYKPSEFASLTGLEITKMLHEAGVPEHVFTSVIGGPAAGEALLNLPLDGYFFTGSYPTGKYIATKVAAKLVPVGLELGGKDPVYVCDDIENIAAAAAGIADGAFYNNGQSCCAVERIYVHQNIYDAFVEAFVNEVKSYKQGNPASDDVYSGPVTRPQALKTLKTQVEDAVAKGGKLLLGGDVSGEKGYYFQNTVIADATHEMLLMREESFGPVIGIASVKNDEEAVKLMNDTDYGLTAAVYSKSQERAQQLFPLLNAGTVYWNCCDRVSAPVPWSGRKNSGLGSTLSHIGIRSFVQPKAYQIKGELIR
jgi:acyl-CoA reductase-like NAD-dependent aldehyde dehydrogenase